MLRELKTESGIVRGLVGKDPRITDFRGIPYAKPPVGELRWRAPQPAEPWEGVRKCYEYGDTPMMRVHPGTDDSFYKRELHPVAADYGMSEDCLYLNIFSPAQRADEKLPVLCYIHGGGLQDGYNYEVEFDGERVARRGVIVVMIGYRLGLFGFLAHPELTREAERGDYPFLSDCAPHAAGRPGKAAIIGTPATNFGFMDQCMALHWVKQNIAAFGGDPDRIVISGQSAGAGSVQAQICSPYNEKGLIAGAICQSAVTLEFGDEEPFMGPAMDLKAAEAYGEDFFRKAGIKDLAEARALSAEELMRRVDTLSDPGVLFGYMFNACEDGLFVTESVSRSYYNDRLWDIPMIVGVCQGETQNLFGSENLTVSDIEKRADVYGDKKKDFLRAAALKTDADAAALLRDYGLNLFLTASREFCELRAGQGHRVYYYVLDPDIPGDEAGSFHGSDLWFTFDSLGNSWRPFEGRHYDLARQVCSYWVNFVKTLDPNGDGRDYNGNPLPKWKAYVPGERAFMQFGDSSIPGQLPECPVADFRLTFGRKLYTDD